MAATHCRAQTASEPGNERGAAEGEARRDPVRRLQLSGGVAGAAMGGRNQVPFMAWVESTEQDFRKRKPAIEFLKKKFMRAAALLLSRGNRRRST